MKEETLNYIVLSDGKEVAGMKSPGEGKLIKLTATQAEHPLRLGHIELKKTK